MGAEYSTYSPGVMQPQLPPEYYTKNSKGRLVRRTPTLTERLFNSRISMFGYPKVYPASRVAPSFSLFGFPISRSYGHRHTSHHHTHTQQPIIVQGPQGPTAPIKNNKPVNVVEPAPAPEPEPEPAPEPSINIEPPPNVGNGGQDGGKRKRRKSHRRKTNRSTRRRSSRRRSSLAKH